MKHTAKVTIILLCVFLCSQLLGLFIIQNNINTEKSIEVGKTVFNELSFGEFIVERPPIENEDNSWIFIVVAILVGTSLVLLIIRFNLNFIWKYWYLFAVIFCLKFAFTGFLGETFAIILSILFAIYKVFKPNVIIHNFTELFIYGGLAVIFVPILNLRSVIIVLIVISFYDMYAVWQSKHMVKLAKFQTKSKMFAGLYIPYALPSKHKTKRKIKKSSSTTKKSKKQVKSEIAVLGGGDIGFPLIFAGVILKFFGLSYAFIIPPFATVALGILFLYSRKGKFYPAMPFISAGCFVGLGLVFILNSLV